MTRAYFTCKGFVFFSQNNAVMVFWAEGDVLFSGMQQLCFDVMFFCFELSTSKLRKHLRSQRGEHRHSETRHRTESNETDSCTRLSSCRLILNPIVVDLIRADHRILTPSWVVSDKKTTPTSPDPVWWVQTTNQSEINLPHETSPFYLLTHSHSRALSFLPVTCRVRIQVFPRASLSFHLRILPEALLHLHHWCAVRLLNVIMLDWNHLNFTIEQGKSPFLERCWLWGELLGKASEVRPLGTMNGHKNHFLSSFEASTQSDPQISVMCGCSWGQRGDLVWDENPRPLLLRKSELKAFPRRTSQLLFTIMSTWERMEPLIMFRWSGQTSGEQSAPNSWKWSCKLLL